MPDKPPTFIIEDAELLWTNFQGKEGRFNKEGERDFTVALDEETAKKMLDDGWNVKYPKPNDEGEIGSPYINVAIRYDVKPPRIVMITSSSRIPLDESSVEILDWADIQAIDLIARGHVWGPINGMSGIKAYLKTLVVTIEEDELERKYKINENPRDSKNPSD